jgi:kumamolisin
MPTPRVVLPGSEKEPAKNLEKLGPSDPSRDAHVLVVLRRKNPVVPIKQDSRIADRQQYASEHGASASDFLAVSEFAKEYNLQPREENAAARTVELHGKIEDLSRAFGVVLEDAKAGDMVHQVREGAITIPENLAGIIQAVLGLDNRPAARPHFRKPRSGEH